MTRASKLGEPASDRAHGDEDDAALRNSGARVRRSPGGRVGPDVGEPPYHVATPVRSLTSPDPRHVFLNASAVMRRYGWGRTKGYQNLKNRDLIPPPVVTHPDRWRLDQLLAWEDRRIAAGACLLDDRQEQSLQPIECRLPGPKRTRRKSA